MSGGGGKGAGSGPAVLLVNSMGTGGAERAVAAVAACLRGRGRDLRVLCLERAAPGSAIELDPPAVELSSLGSGGSAALKLAALPFLARTLAAYVLREGAGTVMSHLFRANFVNVMARDLGGVAHRAAQSATYRAILVNHTRVSRLAGEGLSGRVNAALTRRLYPRADLVASVSRASAAECAAFVRIPEARSIVLYNPVDCAAAVAAVAAAAQSRPRRRRAVAAAAQSRPRPAVVALGRLVALKRFGDLVEAFARLAPDYPELELDIVGEGPGALEAGGPGRGLGRGRRGYAFPGRASRSLSCPGRSAGLRLRFGGRGLRHRHRGGARRGSAGGGLGLCLRAARDPGSPKRSHVSARKGAGLRDGRLRSALPGGLGGQPRGGAPARAGRCLARVGSGGGRTLREPPTSISSGPSDAYEALLYPSEGGGA